MVCIAGMAMFAIIFATAGPEPIRYVFRIGSLADDPFWALSLCLIGIVFGIIIIIAGKLIDQMVIISHNLEILIEVNEKNLVSISENLRMFKEQAVNYLGVAVTDIEETKEIHLKSLAKIDYLTKNLKSSMQLQNTCIESITRDCATLKDSTSKQLKYITFLATDRQSAREIGEKNLEYMDFIANDLRNTNKLLENHFNIENDEMDFE